MDDNCDHDLSVDTMHPSKGSTKPRYQKALIYNKLLPYASDLDEESEALLSEIKENLARAVMLREIQPGCFIWVSKLSKYIRIYGMKFTKEDHILFIKLMYEIITIPDLEPHLLCRFCAALVLLLKKRKLISPSELELPWRPLYELCHRIKISTKSCMQMYRSCACLESTLETLVYIVKVYFPISATQEILDELRPMLYPLRATTMFACLKALQCLLPVQLPVEHHAVGYKLWLDEFMTFWEVCHNATQWEKEIMSLIAELAIHNIGYIDWEPHIPLMFARFIRCLNLPVLYNRMQSVRQHHLETTPIAVWIVATLGNGSSTHMYLEKFLKTVETYFHPSNYGKWLEKLKGLLVQLPHHFILRLHKERYAKPTWETPIPDNYKLTDSDVDAFVKSMMPITMTAMFSKVCFGDAYLALQHLASMRPNLVIPKVLERMNATLDSITEQHNLAAAMTCMEAVARPMVQGPRNVNKGYTYTEGPTHVLPLLFSCLVGIDPNNRTTCSVSLGLISVYASLIPIVDCSRSTAEMDEDERIICEATSRFEDFILQFLDKVFTFIDSSSLEFVRLENRSGNKKSKWETEAEEELAAACTTLLIQTSDKIFQSALHKLRTFVTERILETKVAGQLAAVLCRVFARVNGKDTLRALVPVLSQTILDATGDEDDYQTIIKEENLDNRLLHSMLLLSKVVDTPGCNLLPHINTLTKVLDRVLALKSREGSTLACELLKTILHSLSTTVPHEFRSNGRDYNDPDYPYVRDWGQPLYIESLSVKWYIPGKEEMAVAQEIFSKYLTPELRKLQRYCEDCNTLTREELTNSLNIVSSIIEGCECVLPVWKEPALPLKDSSLDWVPFSPSLGMTEEISMPDGGNVRLYMAGIMCNLQNIILKNAEDDTKSLFVLEQIWSSLLLGNVRLRDAHELRLKRFKMMRKMLQDLLVGNKGHIRRLIIQCAHLQHEERVYSQTFNLTETHKRIMLEVLTLATSRYADVRAKAQSTLFCGLQHFPYAYTFIVPKLIQILKMDTTEHHDAYKGALYILFGRHKGSIVTWNDWKMLRSLWPAIVLSKTSEKPSVIRLKDVLMDTVYKYFLTITIKLEVPDTCLEAAAKLWESLSQPSLPKPNDHEIQRGLEKLQLTGESNLETYNALLDDLLRAILEENLHWRHRLMAMNFIRHLVRPDHMYPPKIVRYFVGALIHDSLGERKLAIRTVVFMLKQQKRKHPKITIDSLPGNKQIESEENHPVSPGQREDNSWLQYNYETRPLTAEQWDEPRFVHQPYIGYYVWPKKLEVYAPSAEQPCLDPEKRQLTEHEIEVHQFFDNPQNIEKLIKYLSLEEKKGKDRFNPPKYFLFKSLFRNHGIVHLKHFLPHLHRLVTDKQESSQRCAAEIIAGIIKGAKHWPFQMTCEMWDALLPIIRLALANMTVEALTDWGRCFSTAQNNRDPNRHHWFLECVMEEPQLADSESSFSECSRLFILESILSQQLWRVSQLMERVITRIEDRLLTNPFEIVRDRLAFFLVTVFNSNLRFPNTRHTQTQTTVQNLIDKVIPKLQYLVEESTTTFKKDEQSLSEQVANVSFDESKEDSKVNNVEREVAIRLFKTVCKWIICTLGTSQNSVLPAFYQLFPIICQLENCDTDEELTKTCSSALAMLAQAVTLPRDIPIVLDAVTKMSKNSSWWTRSTCLKFLQVSVFHNMSLLVSNPTWVKRVSDIVLNLLEDERLEVRESAGNVLGGLLHCTFMPQQEDLLEEFKKKARTKIHKRNHTNKSKMEINGSANIEAIRIRHAGVLGLCAFIQAHPYDVPEYVPSIFEHLGIHMSDPQPIPTTIRKTLSDFKRTHYDGWTGINGHAQHFTEEQLAVLQDLTVPPAHYT